METILQHDERDCGAACLAMVASYYGLKMPISKFRELTKTNESGTNLYGLVEGAGKIGLEGQALSGTEEELKREIQKGQIIFPFIAHTISNDEMLHFVVVCGYKGGTFEICDPGRGKIKTSELDFFKEWTGYIVTFSKSDTFHKGRYTRGKAIRFLGLWKGMVSSAVGILALSIVIVGIGILGAFVFKIIMDESVGTEQKWAFAQVFFPGMLGLYLLQAAIQFVRGNLLIAVSKKIDARLSLSFYDHLIEIPISESVVRQTGDYMSRLSDVATIRQMVSGATLTLLLDTTMVVAGGAILFLQNRILFAISLCMVAAYAIVVSVYQKPIEKNNRQMMEKNANFQSYFKESADGLETIKAACANENVKKKASEKFWDFIGAAAKVSSLSMSQEIIAGSIELIGTMAILWAGFGLVLSGRIEAGTLMTFYALLAYFTQPVKNLCELQPMIQAAVVAADRLDDILEIAKEDGGGDKKLQQIDRVWFENVDFRYGNYDLVLENVTFNIEKGEKVAVVGRSGSGKTSLARLLLRFYDVEDGKIQINENEIQNIQTESLRREISYVSQEEFFFADSVRNNLTLGNEEVSEKELEEACRISGADEVIAGLPFGYGTPLDENGRNLSGGQRQKLAIARALLRKPQLLILDEATSHLDAVAEKKFWTELEKSRKEMICLIIAHRLSAVKDCDKILVMEKGKIVEEGTHEELLRKNRYYFELWNSQQ